MYNSIYCYAEIKICQVKGSFKINNIPYRKRIFLQGFKSINENMIWKIISSIERKNLKFNNKLTP